MGRGRSVAGWTAVGAAAVYVALKGSWVAGGTFGVDDLGDVTRGAWAFDNLVTGGLAVVGIGIALAAIRPWGMRVPVWLVAVPMWVGAGLLAPFVVLMPAGAALQAAGWWDPTPPPQGDPALAPWTFVVVYGSFVVLGAALVLHARDRCRPGVGGIVGQVPLAWVAAVIAAGLALLRLSWVVGGTAGLQRGSGRDAWLRLQDTVTAAQFLCAAIGLLVMVHRWGPRRRFAVPLVATWLGAGGMVAGGVLSMPTILAGERWTAQGQTFAGYATATFLTCVAGALISVVALFLLVERAGSTRQQVPLLDPVRGEPRGGPVPAGGRRGAGHRQ
ncbi:hypothetical protein [Dactylosporangium sp. NPDC005555]|uniref:hypothetical protein n=1 Tax=Dactylosporangium sp. NPDC005555 TaxID=3154889 RepID=UPI0033A17C7D